MPISPQMRFWKVSRATFDATRTQNRKISRAKNFSRKNDLAILAKNHLVNSEGARRPRKKVDPKDELPPLAKRYVVKKQQKQDLPPIVEDRAKGYKSVFDSDSEDEHKIQSSYVKSSDTGPITSKILNLDDEYDLNQRPRNKIFLVKDDSDFSQIKNKSRKRRNKGGILDEHSSEKDIQEYVKFSNKTISQRVGDARAAALANKQKKWRIRVRKSERRIIKDKISFEDPFALTQSQFDNLEFKPVVHKRVRKSRTMRSFSKLMNKVTVIRRLEWKKRKAQKRKHKFDQKIPILTAEDLAILNELPEEQKVEIENVMNHVSTGIPLKNIKIDFDDIRQASVFHKITHVAKLEYEDFGDMKLEIKPRSRYYNNKPLPNPKSECNDELKIDPCKLAFNDVVTEMGDFHTYLWGIHHFNSVMQGARIYSKEMRCIRAEWMWKGIGKNGNLENYKFLLTRRRVILDFNPGGIRKNFYFDELNYMNACKDAYRCRNPKSETNDTLKDRVDEFTKQIKDDVMEEKKGYPESSSQYELENEIHRALYSVNPESDYLIPQGFNLREYGERLVEDHLKATEEIRNRVTEYSKSFKLDGFNRFVENTGDNVKYVLTVIGEWVDSYFKNVPGKTVMYIDEIIRTVFLIYQLIRSRNLYDCYSAIYNYLPRVETIKGLLSKILGSGVIASIVNAIRNALDVPKSEGDDGDFDVMKFLKMTFSSTLLKSVVALIVTVTSFKLFNKDTASSIFKIVGKPKGTSLIELMQSLMESLGRLTKVGGLIIAGKSFTEAIFADDPVSEHIRLGKELLDWKDKLYIGVAVADKMERSKFMAEAKKIKNFLEIAKKNPVDNKNPEVHKVYILLVSALQALEAKIKAVNRPTPWSILLCGDPGIGKSFLGEFVCACDCEVVGVEFDESMVYPYNQASEYHDGHDPDEQPFWFISELARQSTAIAKVLPDEVILFLNSLLDNRALMLNYAYEANKGKVYARPRGVFGDTNNEGLHADAQLFCPAAGKRRWLKIEPIVYPELTKEGTVQLDQSKCAGRRMYDNWTFRVWIEYSNGSKGTYIKEFMSHKPEDNIDKLKVFLIAYFRTWHTQQAELLQKARAVNLSDYGQEHKVYSEGLDEYKIDEEIKINEVIAAFGKKEDKDRLRNPSWNETDGLYNPYSSDEEAELNYDNNMCLIKRERNFMPFDVNDTYTNVITMETTINGTEKTNTNKNSVEVPDDIVYIYSNDIDKVSADYSMLQKFIPKKYFKRYKLARNSKERPDVIEYHVSDEKINVETSMFTRWSAFWKIVMPEINQASSITKEAKNYVVYKAAAGVMKGIKVNVKTKMEEERFFCFSFHRWTLYFIFCLCLLMFKLFAPDRLFIMFLFCFINWTYLRGHVLIEALGNLEEYCDSKQMHAVDAIRENFNAKRLKFYGKAEHYKYYLFCAGALTAVGVGTLAYFAFKPKNPKSEASDKAMPKMRELEEKIDAGKSTYRKYNKEGTVWNQYMTTYTPVHTSDPSSLWELAKGNYRYAEFEHDTLPTVRKMHVFGLESTYVLANNHFFAGLRSGKLKIRKAHIDVPVDQFKTTVLSPKDFYEIGNDLIIVRVSGINFTDVTKHMYRGKYPKCIDSVIKDDVVKCYYIEGKQFVEDLYESYTLDGYFNYMWVNSKKGQCGTPLVGRIGQYSFIQALHTATRENGASFAIPINGDDIELGLKELKARLTLMLPVSQSADYFPETFQVGTKSACNYYELHNLGLYGSLRESVHMNNESALQETSIDVDELDRLLLDEYNWIPDKVYGKPLMKPQTIGGVYFNPFNDALTVMNKNKPDINLPLVEFCAEEFSQYIIKVLEDAGVKELRPFDGHTTINGTLLDDYVRRMNVTASAGYGWNGKKMKYLPLVDGEDRWMVPELEEAVYQMLFRYLQGLRCNPIYKDCLKDEPINMDKFGHTRNFFPKDIVSYIVHKIFLGPFFAEVLANGRKFGSAVGIDMHREARRILKDIDLEKIEGDYRKFDLNQLYMVAWGAMTVIYNVVKHFGYNEYALLAVRAILTDELFPTINVCGDLYQTDSIEPSGTLGTAERNCLRNILMLMIYYYSMAGINAKPFFEVINPDTYGDDYNADVKKEVQTLINNHTYRDFCKDFYDIEVTSPAKDGSMPLFVDTKTMSFLNRTFEFHPVLKRYIAKLRMSSIRKSLMWRMPSKAVTVEDQTVDTCNSALRELYFHSNIEQYSRMRSFLGKYLIGNYLIDPDYIESRLSTYHALTSDLCGGDNWDATNPQSEGSDCTSKLNNQVAILDKTIQDVCALSTFWFSNAFYDKLRIQRNEFMIELKELEEQQEKMGNPLSSLSVRDIPKCQLYASDTRYRQMCDDHCEMMGRISSLRASIQRCNTSLYRNSRDKAQSESDDVPLDKSGTVEPGSESTKQTVQEIQEEMEDILLGKSHATGIMNNTKFGPTDYLKRPVYIDKLTLTLSTDITASYDIWKLLLNQASVRAKIKGYHTLRANLCIELRKTAVPQHYGRVQYAYVPGPYTNDVLQKYVTIGAARRWDKIKYLSGFYGTRSVKVSGNESTIIRVPYVNTQPAMRLFNNSAAVLADNVAYDDTKNMGTLYIHTINQAKATNAGASNPTITIYAWLEDIELGCATGTVTAITSEADERKIGPVETVATGAKEVSKALQKIPYIAPYAKASEMGFGALAYLASLLGWSMPVMNEEPMRMKNEPYQNSCNIIGYDLSQRMTLDPKQELTISRHFCGITEDEMTFASICMQECLLTKFSWPHTETALQGPIWQGLGHPEICETSTLVAIKVVQPSWLKMIAAMFDFWRCDVVFRFEGAYSMFHAGILAVIYEPNIRQEVQIDATLELNKQHLVDIDINQTDSFEVCIPWAQAKPWLRTLTNAECEGTIGTITTPSNYWDKANGYINVTPLTALQSPDNDDVEINVYIKGKNCFFNRLSDRRLPTSRVLSEADDGQDVVSCFELGENNGTTDCLCEDYFGERPVSIKGLLNRFVTSYYEQMAPSANYGVGFQGLIIPPLLPSMTANSVLPVSLINYWRYAFLYMRGELRKRLTFVNGYTVSSTARMKVTLDQITDTTIIPAAYGYSEANPITSSINGTVEFGTGTQGGVQFSVPCYMNNLALHSSTASPYDTTDSQFDPWTYRSYTAKEQHASDPGMLVTEDTAAGEDFVFSRRLGAVPFSYPVVA